jgi:hypothetical protein
MEHHHAAVGSVTGASTSPAAQDRVGALARALPALRGIPGADPFDPAALADAVLDSVRNMREYGEGLAHDASQRGAWLARYADEAGMHAVQDQASRCWETRDAVVRRYAAASLVLSCLTRSARDGDVREVAEDFQACDLSTLLDEADRATFARWLLGIRDAPADVRAEAATALGDGIEGRREEIQERPSPSSEAWSAQAFGAAPAAPRSTRTAWSCPSSSSGIAPDGSTAPSTSIRATPPERPSGFSTVIR